MAKLSNQDLNNMLGCDIETFTGLMKDSITYKLSGGLAILSTICHLYCGQGLFQPQSLQLALISPFRLCLPSYDGAAHT